jgi:diguanylate cyclase (GGDEF)-like protein/PAS domain S-box-containing protein
MEQDWSNGFIKPGQLHEITQNLSLLGRPKAITDEYLARLQELANNTPEDYGYSRKQWTGKLLKQHLAHELGMEVSDRHINRLLQQMGLSIRQRRQRAAKAKARLGNNNCSMIAGEQASISLSTERRTELDIVWASQEGTDLSQVLATNTLLSTAIETITDAVEITDSEARYLYVNSAFERVTGYTRQEAIGRTPAALLRSDRQDDSFYRDMFNTVRQGQIWQGLYTSRRKSGSLLDLEVTLSPILNKTGELTHIVAVKREIPESRQTSEILYYQAFHDHLTGLPNRVLFRDRLTSALSNVRRNQGLLAAMFLDMDHFKGINDTLGHAMGDRVLQQAATRIQRCIRAGETLSRWGGDEFVLLLPNLTRNDDAMQVAQRILTAIGSVFEVDGHCFRLSVSIGIAFSPQDGQDAETLLNNADAALYKAKESGRNCFRYFISSRTTGRSGIVPRFGPI